MFKADHWIAEQVEKHRMIEPFVGEKVRDGVISYGLGHYGYDLRLAPQGKMYRMLIGMVKTTQIALIGDQGGPKVHQVSVPLNPKEIADNQIVDFGLAEHSYSGPGPDNKMVETDAFVIPAGSMLLGSSVEYLRIPENVLAFGWGKSTYARVGLIVNITPIEPGWEGNLTLSITNVSDIPVMVYPNEGIAQICFYECDERPSKTYEGKYQANVGAVTAQVE